MSAAPHIPRVATHVPFRLRREMAKRFGYVEPRPGGRWAVRFQLGGQDPPDHFDRVPHRTAERLIRDGMSRDEAQAAVMRVMGHTSKATSDRYVKLASETLRGVIE